MIALGVIVFVIVAAIGTSSVSPTAHGGSAESSDIQLSHSIKSKKHGWITTRNSVDFWRRPDDVCTAIEAGADEMIAAQREGRDPDVNVASRIVGYTSLENGVRVKILGHAKPTCSGTSGAIPMTQVRVDDADSTANRRTGYISEGLLSHQ